MVSYARHAKLLLVLAKVFAVGWMACALATLIEIVRGFSDHAHWWHALAWGFGVYVCINVADDYFKSALRYAEDADRVGEQ